jgi:hypothetical protein
MPRALRRRRTSTSGPAQPDSHKKGLRMFDDVEGLDGEMKHIVSLLDQVRSTLGDRFLRLELADHLAPKSTPFRVPSGLGAAIDKRIAPAGMDALHLFKALRDVNKDVPDNPDKLDVLIAAMGKLRQSLIPLTAEVAIQVGFK